MDQVDRIEVDQENQEITVRLPVMIGPTDKIIFSCGKVDLNYFQIGDLTIRCEAEGDYVYFVEVKRGEEEIVCVGDIEVQPDSL